jgi:hypothetical protein
MSTTLTSKGQVTIPKQIAVVDVDTRSPQQIIGNIEAQGRIVADALARLNVLMSVSEMPH